MRRHVAIRVAKIAGSTAGPAFATDHAGKMLAWNRVMEGLLGHTTKEVLGRNCRDVFDGADVFGNLHYRHNCPLLDYAHPPPNCTLRAQVACRSQARRGRIHGRWGLSVDQRDAR